MNLKKIGSALTAISMIASMATYVPFSASAADTVYTGTLDYYPDVAYSLNVTSTTLTLSPATTGATYEIPATVLEEVAYDGV